VTATTTTTESSAFDGATAVDAPTHRHAGQATAGVRIATLMVVVVPLIGVVAMVLLLWGWGFSWVALRLMLGMYLLTGLGITVGYQRLFTHHAFETTATIKFVFAVLGAMAFEGPVLKWVAMHRWHHQHSDDPQDPHSPHHGGPGVWGVLGGAWHAHVGWVFGCDPDGLSRYAGDLAADPVVRFVSKTWWVWSVAGLLIPAVLGGLLTGTWMGVLLGFVWAGLARVFLVHHVTWSVNSVCHLWGTRPFCNRDESRNNAVFGVLALGEGWHNNHHAFPTSARHGLRWWQVDASYLVIRGLAAVGLAWKVRVPATDAIGAKRRVPSKRATRAGF
jgi:stearoyl-CoA desaturase (Delta-9 desaturase)